MKEKSNLIPTIFLTIALFLTIIDAKFVLVGAQNGVMLCLYTIIPSLFPFIVISNMITPLLIGQKIPVFRAIGKRLGVPTGAESILLLGTLGGFPVGAQVIYDIYKGGFIDKHTAKRLLGFCNNAGPAFIFGIVGTLFSKGYITWSIWGIHVISAFLVGIILPKNSIKPCNIYKHSRITVSQSIEKSLRVLASICCWVILFRIIIHMFQRWFLWCVPRITSVIISGILELSNGCLELTQVMRDGERYILSIGMLSMGGFCVGMQTMSVTKELGPGLYFPGKLLQTAIGLILAYFCQILLFSSDQRCKISFVWGLIPIGVIVLNIFLLRKNR